MAIKDSSFNSRSNSFAATVLVSESDANSVVSGGLVGEFAPEAVHSMTVHDSYADCYLSGKTVGGLVGTKGGNGSLSFTDCYSAGFLCGSRNAVVVGGITTTSANNVTRCYSLMNYDDISNESVFTVDNLKFDTNNYVTKYPNAVPKVSNAIYPIAAAGGTITGCYYTYGGQQGEIVKRNTGGIYHSMFELLHGVQKAPNEFFNLNTKEAGTLKPYKKTDILETHLTRLPVLTAESFSTLPHFGDWLERPMDDALWARVYKNSEEKYVMYFEKGGRNEEGDSHTGETFISEYRGDGEDGFLTYTGSEAEGESDENCPWRYYETANLSKITDVIFTSAFYGDAKPNGMRNFFCGMSGLTNITNIKYLNSSKVLTMKGAFKDCSSLTTIAFGAIFQTSKVTDMSNMFEGCSALETLQLESFTQEVLTNTSRMFYGCSNLTAIQVIENNFEPAKQDTVTNSEDMFTNCSELQGDHNTGPYIGNRPSEDITVLYDKTYALIDKAGQPGYFSIIPSSP